MFGDKLKLLRVSHGMTQDELCQKLGIVRKTLSDYENSRRYPKSTEMLAKIGALFGVSVEYLLSDEDVFLREAETTYGSRGRAKAERLISETSALFAGGELNDEDKELVFRAITELYFETRETNKKYTPRKYRQK